MLYTLAVILLIAWLLGMVGTYTIGAFIHVLLVVAIVLFLVGLAQRPAHRRLDGRGRPGPVEWVWTDLGLPATDRPDPTYGRNGSPTYGARSRRPRRRGRSQLVLARRLGAEQMPHEIVPPPPHHVRLRCRSRARDSAASADRSPCSP